MYRDVPGAWDAWDIDSMYGLTPVDLPKKASVEVLEQGPLVARLRIARRINDSDLVQVVSLRRGSRRVDFETTVDWQESHKLLKVCFPVRYHASEALHEIQFGTCPADPRGPGRAPLGLEPPRTAIVERQASPCSTTQ
jgi:alpha-mannosidase